MNEAFEKILERLEKIMTSPEDDSLAETVSTRVWNKAVGWAKRIVKEAEKDYNNGWIPCKKRLPEESGYYLVTYHEYSDGNYLPKYDDTYVRRLHYQISDSFTGWNYPVYVDKKAENDSNADVIAWQPLPEPFKESEEE